MAFRKNQSGQPLYFGLASLSGGNAVTGASGAISGRKAIDGGSLVLLSGNIVEDGGGLYHANLYDFDTNGNSIGFVFTCSGCAPVFFEMATEGNVSGAVFLASGSAVGLLSGQVVQVYSGNLSGQQVTTRTNTDKSGYTADVLSGTVWLTSGHQAALYSGQIVQLYSGQSVITAVNQDKSGYTATIQSGTAFLAQGSLFVGTYASGVLDAYIPDKVLVRDFTALSGVIASGTSGRCVVNALRKLTNKFDMTLASGFLTIYQEDDSTVAFQQAVTAVSGVAPVTGLDTR